MGRWRLSRWAAASPEEADRRRSPQTGPRPHLGRGVPPRARSRRARGNGLRRAPRPAARWAAEGGIEKRLEAPAERRLDVARVEEGRERVLEPEPHAGSPPDHEAGRREPPPGRPLTGGETPGRRTVNDAPAGLGHDLLRDQEPELDPDPGEADALAARPGRGRDVVVPGELAPPHAVSVVDHGKRGSSRVGREADLGGAGVERVRHDLGEDRLLDRPGIRVPEVFEKMQEVDSRLAHRWVEPTASPRSRRSRRPGGRRRRWTGRTRPRLLPRRSCP